VTLVHNSSVTGKGFFNSTVALLTAVGTVLAALVALGVFLLGEGVLFKGGSGGDPAKWTGEKAPSQQECADLLETHGKTGTYPIEIGSRFCVRSSGGRTAYLAVISNGEEYQVSVWKKG